MLRKECKQLQSDNEALKKTLEDTISYMEKETVGNSGNESVKAFLFDVVYKRLKQALKGKEQG